MHAPVEVLGDGSDAPVPLTASTVPHAEIDESPGVAVVADRDGPREQLPSRLDGASTFDSNTLRRFGEGRRTTRHRDEEPDAHDEKESSRNHETPGE
jgi:hypothetical protein